MTRNSHWPRRLRTTAVVLHVVGLFTALIAVLAMDGMTQADGVAALFAAAGVGLSASVAVPIDPGDTRSAVRSWLGILGETVCLLIAIGLTDGVTSSFAILLVATIFLAAVSGGIRMAGPITIIAVAGLVIVSGVSEVSDNTESFIRTSAIYLIAAVAFSEIQRALLTESERADDLALASDALALRRSRLEETHDLLADLLEVAMSPELNAVAAAQDALRDVGTILPEAPSRIVSVDGVTLARRGDSMDTAATIEIPIEATEAPAATLLLWLAADSLTLDQRTSVEQSVGSVGLALENDSMVHQLAGVAIQRERVRLARELHDDVAPTVASVGLALDMVLLGPDVSPDQQATLEATRTNVTRLVDQIRSRVQDLRADRSVSIVELAGRLVAEVDTDGPTVSIDIEERTPPRPAVALEVGSLVTEAFRNAVAHANATQITIRGRIAANEGVISVIDDGIGFDPANLSTRRFGLVGMKERANLVGADFTIESTSGQGSTISVRWKENT